MAGEKKMEKGMCEGCCGGMCGMCAILSGVFVLAAGGAFLAFGLGSLDGMTAHLVGGGALLLYGLGLLVHSLGLCPMCK